MLWIYCRVWSDIHILLGPLFSGWISRCLRCAHLWSMCAGGLVLKNCEGVQINFLQENLWWWNLYLYIWSSFALIPIWFWIFLCCCMLVLTRNMSSLILCAGKCSHSQRKIHGYFHILVVFGHKRGQGYPWDCLVVLWDPSYFLALYYGYLGGIDGSCSSDFICVNPTVSDLVILDGFFSCLCIRPFYELL